MKNKRMEFPREVHILKEEYRVFIDESVITVKSGDGGNGCASFRREKAVQFGGPDGGDGADGGSIIFVADPNINTLVDFKYNKSFKAPSGGDGKSKNMKGMQGENLVIKVPIGTMVRDFETNKLLLDLNTSFEERVFLQGGRGGLGNTHFKNAVRRAPSLAQKGRNGKEVQVRLELKLLADVALVGYPNVGKSSLINKISAAKSKVANYHFTTLTPKLGVVRVAEEKSFVVADIPGLVEGAHTGVGLGDKFLRHIERCKMIYHLIDVSGSEGRDPIEDFDKINKELKNYSEKLFSKRQIVLANKMDMLYDKEPFERLKKYVEEKGFEIYPVSVLTGTGIKDIIYKTYDIIQKIEREPLEEETDVQELIHENMNKKPDWIITEVEDGVFDVGGKIVERVIEGHIFKNEESIVGFLQLMRQLGLDNKLRNAGAKDGDIILMAGLEFDFVE